MVHTESPATHGARRWPARRTLAPDVALMLFAARRDRGWSVREAARRIGCAPGSVIYWEYARRALSTDMAEAVIAAYGLPPRDADRLRPRPCATSAARRR